MNIKEWKQFSDFIDEHNEKLDEELCKINKTKPFSYVKTSMISSILPDKTLGNFYEWKCGKLTMGNIKRIINQFFPKKRLGFWNKILFSSILGKK